MFNNEDRRGMVTPLDLRQARFKTAVRGFDKAQVTTMLEDASAGYDDALRENERLRQEIARLEGSLQQFRSLESGLKNALVTAQQAADDLRRATQQATDDMRQAAQQDATRILREAETQAEFMIERAQAKCDDVHRDIEGLKLKRREAETDLEALVATLTHTLDYIRQQETTRALQIA
jgi:cell division initiation protein